MRAPIESDLQLPNFNYPGVHGGGVGALENHELVNEGPAIVGRQTPSAVA